MIIHLNEKDKLSKILVGENCHISKNFFKKYDNHYILMVTYRNYDCTLEYFDKMVNMLKNKLNDNGFEYEKVIIEFSIYDSKIEHDNKWLNYEEKRESSI